MAFLVGVSAAAIAGPAHADLPLLLAPPAYNLAGQTGLLDMPTARFQADGEMSATVSSMHALDRYSLGFQALPWLETTFRYSRIDRFFGTRATDLYDRSLGVKVRLSQETSFWPNIAIGTQDILGTGQVEGDYLVASKRFGTLDFTLGIGWRRFGGFASFDNPIGEIFPSFKKTGKSVSTGVPLVGQLFHGPKAGLFGGVSWQTPIDGLQLLLEVSGDKYETQQARGAIDIRTPVNVGFSYEPWNGVQIGAGYLYGSTFGLRFSFHMNPFDPEPSVRLGEQPTPITVRTPEERQDAVLDILQDKTHYYANWPGNNAAKQANLSSSSSANPLQASFGFVDAAFGDAEKSDIALTNVEAYGDSLIFDVQGKGPLSCATFRDIADMAAKAGFHQIALTSHGDVAVCDLKISGDSGSNGIIAISAVEPANNNNDRSPNEGSKSADEPLLTEKDLKGRILKKADAQGIFIESIVISPTRIDVAYSNGQYRANAEAIGRLLRILMSEAPGSVEDFRLISLVGYVPSLGWTFHRSDIERIYMNDGIASELLPVTEMSAVNIDDAVVAEATELSFPRFNWGIGPGLHQSYFDPDNPYNFAVYASVSAGVDLTQNLSIFGDFEANIYTTFTNDKRLSNSLLPHVRTDFVSYYQQGKNGINSLEASYFTKLSPDVYAIGRAGYLESMFAGVGGEILWQPPHQRWAIGADIYGVQQRAFDRLFGLRNYKVVTGHVGLYYASPIYGLDFALYAGRYLAGDYGATFEVRRHFDNGIEVGVYATLTNVPFHIYGEGSFDKGFIIRIPLDFLAPINTQRVLTLDFTPLTRDGGQRLGSDQTLFYGLQRAGERDMLENWQDVLRP